MERNEKREREARMKMSGMCVAKKKSLNHAGMDTGPCHSMFWIGFGALSQARRTVKKVQTAVWPRKLQVRGCGGGLGWTLDCVPNVSCWIPQAGTIRPLGVCRQLHPPGNSTCQASLGWTGQEVPSGSYTGRVHRFPSQP